MNDQRFPSKHRIRRDSEFRRACRQGMRASDKRLLIYGCKNGFSHSRLGVSVSRRLGGAVVRNRWKRLIREAFRLSRQRLPEGIDLVVVPGGRAEPELPRLMASLATLAARVARKLAKDQQ